MVPPAVVVTLIVTYISTDVLVYMLSVVLYLAIQ